MTKFKAYLVLFQIILAFFQDAAAKASEDSIVICPGRHRSKRGLWEMITNFFNPTTPSPNIHLPRCRSTWMSQLSENTTKKFIGELVIPGSHNAFCTEQDMSEESKIGSDFEKKFVESFDLPRTALTSNKDILAKWSVTQSLSTRQQLEVGVRFFDLRIAKDKTTNELHIVHGLMGKKLFYHLNYVMEFLEENQREIVFLYFQKYYNMDVSDGLEMTVQINKTFGNKICKPTNFGYIYDSTDADNSGLLSSLTLQGIWQNRCQVFLFTNLDVTINEYNRFFGVPSFYWENLLMYDGSWGNTNSIRRMLQHAEERLESLSEERKHSKIYAIQAILTPSGLDIVFRNGLKQMATGANLEFVKWMSNKTGLNIIVGDFVERHDLVGKIIAQN